MRTSLAMVSSHIIRGHRRPLLRLLGFLIPVAVLALLPADASSAAGPSCPLPLAERQRYGFVAITQSWPQEFPISQLRAGWAVDFAHSEPGPAGMDRALVIRTYPGYVINPRWLGPLVDAHPGAIWLIGNEPDCIWQDNLLPEEYARIYRDLYHFIKSRDQTSQIAAGGIVQPTPLRLQYLDHVLAAYQSHYRRPMPVDLWHIHNAILNEERGSWGADIPPGIAANTGAIRAIDDNDNMGIFRTQIWAFRQWMADRGYAGYPLIVTEYGVLMPALYGFDAERVNAFMSATFDFFRNATDEAWGDPTDNHRLVQRWAWFSLDVHPWHPLDHPDGFNGNLFNPDTQVVTAHGLNYASHTSSLPPLSYVDLGLATWEIPPMTTPISPSSTATRTVGLRIVNMGTMASGSFAVALDLAGPVSAAFERTIMNLPASSSEWITFTLANLPPGRYDVSVEIDPQGQVSESRECNNQDAVAILVPTHRVNLPLVVRDSGLKSTQPGSRHGDSDASDAAEPAARTIPGNHRIPGTSREEAVDSLQFVSTNPRTGPEPPGGSGPTTNARGFVEFEVPTASSYPAQITVDRQDRVWISERDGNKIARFDPGNGDEPWHEYEIPTPGSQPWGLALDSNGNLWFAETAANRIGKLSPTTGTFAEYPIPTPDSQPWDVAIGSDGAVWFTEREGNKIGKVTPATGAIAEYSLLTPDAKPTSIDTRGTHVWFTETAANKLGWIQSESLARYEFDLPTRDSRPQDLVLTSYGNPWLTEQEGDKIAVFLASTIQIFTEVPVRTAHSEPYGIALEGGTAVWFTERLGNRLGRYTGASGGPQEYPLPTPNSAPTGIAVDSAGCAWYTAPPQNRVGRLCLYRAYLPLIPRNRS